MRMNLTIKRIGLFSIAALSFLPIFYIDRISGTLSILLFGLLSFVMAIFLLWYMKDLTSILESIFETIFVYNDDIVSSEEATEWCRENVSCWRLFNDKYYFLFRKDAMAFKLTWL